MPGIGVVLAVLIAALALAAAGALFLADRAVAPVRRTVSAAPGSINGARAALRATARRNVAALAVSAAVLVVGSAVVNVFARAEVGDAVFAMPLLASAAGVGAFAVMQRRLMTEPVGAAALNARLAQDFSRRRSFVAVGLLAALLVLLVVFALVATPVAAFAGARAVVLPVSLGVLAVAARFALGRVAARAALPARLAQADVALRRAGNRFVLLLSAAGLLATIAAVAVQAGGWLWESGPVLLGATPSGNAVLLTGIAVTVVGVGAGIGATAAIGALLAASTRRLLPAPTSSRAGTPSLTVAGVDA